MLRKEEELDLNGFMSGQELANELYAQKTAGDVAMPATTMHQTFRESGLSHRGRNMQRGRTARTVLSNYSGRNDGYERGSMQSGRQSQMHQRGMRGMAQSHQMRGRGQAQGSV